MLLKSKKLVSVITVNYNHHHLTDELLASIFEKNNYSPIEIIVVDNGSMENPVPGWKQKYINVKFIRSEKNLGFGGGTNLGISAARGHYLFLVNNDTEITPDLINELAATLDKNSNVGIVSPKILYYNTDI